MRHLGFLRYALGACSALGVLTISAASRADEPRKVTEPSVLRESAEITSVADAFDDEDPFDLHLTLGFQQSWRSGHILRESNSGLDQFSSGNFVANNVNVADYSETTSRLNTRAEIGIYKEIALVLRLPVILSNSQKLEGLGTSVQNQSVVLQGLPGEQLFRLPFESPTRGGIEYFAVGLNANIMSQQRDRTKPTWQVGIEGRFNVSEPMRACGGSPLNQPGGNQLNCAYPSDINRNGVGGEFPDTGSPQVPGGRLEGTNFSGGRKEGVSRGTTGLEVHTYISKRTKYIEPYGGFSALFEFQNASSDYGQTDLQGSLVNHPPFRGSLVGGLAVIPWEVRDAFQRIELDFRATGTYVTEGRDYSPLFDALGSSDAPSLRRPNFASYETNPSGNPPSVVNVNSQRVYFTGLTDVQQHGIYRFATQLTFQAGEYVKFSLGGAFTAEQGHVITFDQPCNPDIKKDAGTAGPCSSTSGGTTTATGIPNPNYRPVVNTPGRRFRVDDVTMWDAWINAIVMF